MNREELIEDIKGMIIEKTVIPASIAFTDTQEDAVYDRLTLDIVAVFEKAHAPTDDEREALATALEDVHDEYVTEGGCDFHGWRRGWRPGERATVNATVVDPILATLRHSEVPEPSVDDLITTRAGLALANAAWQEGASTMLRSVNEHDDGKPGHRTPWSKPVSPYSGTLLTQIKAERQTILGGEGCYCEPTGYEPVTGHGGSCPLAKSPEPSAAHGTGVDPKWDKYGGLPAWATENESEPQGEPSDAEVIAASNAYRDERLNSGHMNADVHVRCMRAALRAAMSLREEGV